MLDLVAAGEEQHRIEAAADQHRARLALLEIFLADQPAMLAGRNPHAGVLLVVRDGAVGAEIDPAGVGVLHDHDAIGADVAAAVLLVDHRHRKLEQVDGVVAIDVLQDRPARHRHRRDQLEVALHAVAIGLHHRGRIVAVGKAERERDAPAGIVQAGDDAHARRIALDAVEQHRRRASRIGMREDFRQHADLEVPVGAVDARELADAVGIVDDVAHVRQPLVRAGPGLGDVGVQHASVSRFARATTCRTASITQRGNVRGAPADIAVACIGLADRRRHDRMRT